jgi:transposase
MQAVTTIGLDIAKSVFQIHGVDAAGNVIVRRQLKRRYVLPFFQKLPPCLIGIEACCVYRKLRHGRSGDAVHRGEHAT